MIHVGMKVVGIQKITYPAFKADNDFFFYNNHHLHSPYETQKKVHIFYCLYLHVHPSLNNPIYDVFKKWTKERGFSIRLFIHWQVVLLDCVHFSLISFCEQATLGKGKNYQNSISLDIHWKGILKTHKHYYNFEVTLIKSTGFFFRISPAFSYHH